MSLNNHDLYVLELLDAPFGVDQLSVAVAMDAQMDGMLVSSVQVGGHTVGSVAGWDAHVVLAELGDGVEDGPVLGGAEVLRCFGSGRGQEGEQSEHGELHDVGTRLEMNCWKLFFKKKIEEAYRRTNSRTRGRV